MNRKKIALTATAVLLAAAGLFAGIKKAVPAHVYFLSNSSTPTCHEIIVSNVSSHFTNSAGTNLQAQIRTEVNGTLLSLWSTATCSTNKVYFKN